MTGAREASCDNLLCQHSAHHSSHCLPFSFIHRYVEPIEDGRKRDAEGQVRKTSRKRMHVLQAKTSKIMHRRDFSVLTKDLPPKAEYVVYIRLSAVQRKMYVMPLHAVCPL